MYADCPPSISVSKTNWLNEVAELPLLSTAGILVVIASVKAVSALPVTLALLIENVGRHWGMQPGMLPKMGTGIAELGGAVDAAVWALLGTLG